MIRTYQPKKRQRRRTTGFLARMKVRKGGRLSKVLKRRMVKGRWKLTPTFRKK